MKTIQIPDVPSDVFTCTIAHIDLVLEAMKHKGLTYTEDEAEDLEGIQRIYSYNPSEQSFWLSETDIVDASFYRERAISQSNAHARLLSCASLFALRQAGFHLPYIPT